MTHSKLVLSFGAATLVLAAAILAAGAKMPARAGGAAPQAQLDFSRIYWEYNSSANDLGVHVTLDGEDWNQLEIENPDEEVIFNVVGSGPYEELGMTELFYEGAEPNLADFPLDDLLDLFPEGRYDFSGTTVDGEEIEGSWRFSHAIPAGPEVFADVGPNGFLRIRWNAVNGTPAGFPNRPIHIVGYQVIVESFQVTVPASVRSVTVPPEFASTLASGPHQFEVLAIDRSTNQTITEGSFVK
jgi:hypothetical protein